MEMRTIIATLCLLLAPLSARAAPCDGLTPERARAAALGANLEMAGTKILPDAVSDLYEIGGECRVTLITTMDGGRWRHSEWAVTKAGDKVRVGQINGPIDDAPGSRRFH